MEFLLACFAAELPLPLRHDLIAQSDEGAHHREVDIFCQRIVNKIFLRVGQHRPSVALCLMPGHQSAQDIEIESFQTIAFLNAPIVVKVFQ